MHANIRKISIRIKPKCNNIYSGCYITRIKPENVTSNKIPVTLIYFYSILEIYLYRKVLVLKLKNEYEDNATYLSPLVNSTYSWK